jgi:DNA-binding NarL/FixJ family response regulator
MSSNLVSEQVEDEALRVMVVDDDPIARRALREALAPGHFELAGEAADGEEAVDVALAQRPDIVLMDADMPVVDGVSATVRIRRGAPEVRVVMLAATDDEELAWRGLRAGASGFLTKDVTSAALVRAVRGVAHGEAAISRSLAMRLVERLRLLPDRVAGMRPVHSNLTSREWQVLDLMSTGHTTEGIARELVLSMETVRSHVKHILAKFGAHSRAEAIAIAEELRRGGDNGD